jgi:hypothetical protein
MMFLSYGLLDRFAPVGENLFFYHSVELLGDACIHSDGDPGFNHFEPSV